jgi:hypothetical protein
VQPYGPPKRYFSTYFGLPTPPKSTVRALLLPLFGQFQKVNSANFAVTEFSAVRLRACADRDTMAPRKKRTRDAFSETVRGACPRTCRPLASAHHACHRTSCKNLFDLSRYDLLHDPSVRARGGCATQVRTVCLTEWSSSYYSPAPGEPAAEAGALRAEPPVGA